MKPPEGALTSLAAFDVLPKGTPIFLVYLEDRGSGHSEFDICKHHFNSTELRDVSTCYVITNNPKKDRACFINCRTGRVPFMDGTVEGSYFFTNYWLAYGYMQRRKKLAD